MLALPAVMLILIRSIICSEDVGLENSMHCAGSFMKIDVEGSEYNIMADPEFTSDHVGSFAVEFHDIELHQEAFIAILHKLNNHGGYLAIDKTTEKSQKMIMHPPLVRCCCGFMLKKYGGDKALTF